MRKGTFWPTRIEAAWLSSVVMLGVESRFALLDCPSAWIRMPYLSSSDSPTDRPADSAGATGSPSSREDRLERPPAVGEGGRREPGLRRRVAEAELHAQRLGDVARNLDDRRLDQHLRPALVELRDQRPEVVLDLGPRPDHHRVDVGGGLDGDVLGRERRDRRRPEAQLRDVSPSATGSAAPKPLATSTSDGR